MVVETCRTTSDIDSPVPQRLNSNKGAKSLDLIKTASRARYQEAKALYSFRLATITAFLREIVDHLHSLLQRATHSLKGENSSARRLNKKKNTRRKNTHTSHRSQ